MITRVWLFLFILGLQTLRGADAPSKEFLLRVGYLPATHDTLLFIAAEEKFFPPNLEVQLIKYTSSPDILNDLRGQKIDMAIPGVAAPVQRIAEGAPFVMVGGAAQESAAVVVAPAQKAKFFDGDHLRPLDARLRGFAKLRIGSVKLSTGDALFRCAISDAHVAVSIDDSYHNPKDVLLDLKGGKLDAAVLWSPHMTTAEYENMPIVLWLGEVLKQHVCCRQVVRQDYLVAKHEAVVLYLTALIKAKALYDSAQQSDAAKERVLNAVRKYVNVDPKYPVLEKELFGSDPRTKLSIDLNEQGISAYLAKMAQENIISADQVDQVKKRVDATLIMEAYKRLGLTEEVAQRAVSQGFESLPAEIRIQLAK